MNEKRKEWTSLELINWFWVFDYLKNVFQRYTWYWTYIYIRELAHVYMFIHIQTIWILTMYQAFGFMCKSIDLTLHIREGTGEIRYSKSSSQKWTCKLWLHNFRCINFYHRMIWVQKGWYSPLIGYNDRKKTHLSPNPIIDNWIWKNRRSKK